MEKVLLDSNSGKYKRGVRIIISSILKSSSEKIWNKILNIETLTHICKPMATFKPLSKKQNLKWETDKEYIFKLFIYGFIPFGNHKIVLEKLDRNDKVIVSKEHNGIVKIWNHKITMENEENNTIKYTDEVEIYAGAFTLFVAAWGRLFYKHRQKKWQKIAKTL